MSTPYRTTKYIPQSRAEEAILGGAEEQAVTAYRNALFQAGQKAPIDLYDFHRGFEYGVQWALDNPNFHKNST